MGKGTPDALDVSAYTKKELRDLAKLLKEMGDEAQRAANTVGVELAKFGLFKIQQAGHRRGKAESKIVDGGRVRQASKLGEIAFGAKAQTFSGGGTTQMNYGTEGGPGLLAGYEFGAKQYSQFPKYSGLSPSGRGSRGYFIYPTLWAIQPDIVEKWTKELDSIIKGWS